MVHGCKPRRARGRSSDPPTSSRNGCYLSLESAFWNVPFALSHAHCKSAVENFISICSALRRLLEAVQSCLSAISRPTAPPFPADTSEFLFVLLLFFSPVHIVRLVRLVTPVPIAPGVRHAQQRTGDAQHIRQHHHRIWNA